MPLIVNVGFNKKLGLPGYSSVGASCSVAVELSSQLLFEDLDRFHGQVRQAYTACAQAVAEELARQQQKTEALPQAEPSAMNASGDSGGNGHGHAPPPRPRGRRATANQIRAIYGLADRLGLDLAGRLEELFGVTSPEELSITEASQLIEAARAQASDAAPSD